MTDRPLTTKAVDLATTCLPARKGDHAYWRVDGVLKCRHCGTPSAEVPKVTIAGIELDACSEWAKRIQAERDTAGFHWRNDRYFKRLEDGSVRVRRFEWSHGTVHAHDWIIPAAEWASIVCSVSAAGETLERWQASQRFHDAQPAEPAARLEYQPGSLTEEEIAGGADIPNCLRCGRTLFGGHSHDSRWYCSSETKGENDGT